MAVPEPGGALWQAVRAISDPWPPDDEDTVRELAEHWRRGGRAATEAGAQTSAVGSGITADWRDGAGAAATERTAGTARRMTELAGHMDEAAAGADGYAAVLTRTKSDITSAVAANDTVYATLANPALGVLGPAMQQAFAAKLAAALQAMVQARAAALPTAAIGAPANGPAAGPPGPPPPGATPEQNKAWWDALSEQDRAAILREHPEWVGGRNGIPIEARDTANRTLFYRQFLPLEQDRTDTRDELADLQRQIAENQRRIDDPNGNLSSYELSQLYLQNKDLASRSDELSGHLRELDHKLGAHATVDAQGNPVPATGMSAIDDALRSDKPYYLIDIDSSGEGRVALSLGNPDTATNVGTFVPGILTDIGSTGAAVQQLDELRDAAGGNTAVVGWYDYDTPDSAASGLTPFNALNAAPALSDFQHGLRVTHTGAPSHNTVIGYSYGSTVTGAAAADSLDADDLVFVGSPGVIAENAGQLHVPPGHVWATTSDGDDVIGWGAHLLGQNGPDPTGSGFQAQVFGSDHGIGHSEYWDPAKAPVTIGNVGAIIAGRAPSR